MLCPPQLAQGELTRALLSNSKASTSSVLTNNGASTAMATGNAKPTGFAGLLLQARQSQPGSARGGTPVLTVSNAAAPPAKTIDTQAEVTRITRAVRCVFLSETSDAGTSYQDIYIATERIVLEAQGGDVLYDRVKVEMERAMGEIARSLRAGTSAAGDGGVDMASVLTWLGQLSQAWTTWCNKVSLVSGMLAILDRAYIFRRDDLLSIWKLGLELFKRSVMESDELKSRALTSINAAANAARKSGIDEYRNLHHSILTIFTTLDEYDAFEVAALQATHDYYAAEGQEAIARLDVASYLAHIDAVFSRDAAVSAWLYHDGKGVAKSLLAARHELVQAHAATLVAGLPALLKAAATPSLQLLYLYLEDVRQHQALRVAFGKYIYEHGESIVVAKDNEENMIEQLLAYKALIDNIVQTAFKGDAEFRQTQKESFERFVNKRENKTAELIAKFLDARLRSGNKTMSDQELEHVLDETLILFRYCHAKDMFEEFYKRLFAKRLLLNRSASSDAEQSMLLKLKDECGPAFTQRLETMLTDISLSDEMMQGFSAMRASDANASQDTFELSVNVLTQAHWPTYPQTQLTIPPEMAMATERFANYYETRNQGRKLDWAHTLGTTSIVAQFAKAGEKELLVSEFQTVVLLLFNDLAQSEKLTYQQIRERTGLEDKELKRTLQSLACGQIPTRVLRKEPQGKDVHEGDAFHVNEALKNDRKRIRINMIQLNETQEEQKSTVDRVMFDRELVLQATAVRILKAKKTIKHAELLQEIVQAIASRFTVDVAEIKKTFEILIDKEYMERVEGQRGVYQYLA